MIYYKMWLKINESVDTTIFTSQLQAMYKILLFNVISLEKTEI